MKLLGSENRDHTKIVKKKSEMVWLIFLMLIIILLIPTQTSSAASEGEGIELQMKAGFQGIYKQQRGYPLQVLLTNRTSKPLMGDVVLSYDSNDNATTDYIQSVELPIGEAITVTFGVQGAPLNKDSNLIRFFEGSYSPGQKTIPIIGKDYMDGSSTDSYLIGVVSRDPDTLNFMPSLNQKGYDIKVIPLNYSELPNEAYMLDTLDALVLNDIGTGQWSDQTVQAIKDWVIKGGTLVLSGGAGYSKTAEAFLDIAPLEGEGTTELMNTDALSLSGSESLVLNSAITISEGNPLRGEVKLSEDGLPLAMTSQSGFGTVIYVGWDPSLEPLASWQGSAIVWSKLLQHNLTAIHMNVNVGGSSYYQRYWDMSYLIDQFPSIKQPDISVLLLLFCVYVLLVAPILYLILKKVDRREWAWWMIPTLSVVMGMVILFIGAGDKRNISTHTIEVIQIAEDGHAVVSGGSGLFVPNGGQVKVELPKQQTLQLYSDDYNSNGVNLKGDYQMIGASSSSEVVWRDVPYWSTRKLWMDGRIENPTTIGRLVTSYEEVNGQTKLTVTNETNMDLTKVALVINGIVVEIGDLKQGESGSINKPVYTNNRSSSHYNYSNMLFPYSNSNNGEEWARQRQLMDYYFNSSYNGAMAVKPVLATMKPVIIGFGIDNEVPYLVNGKKVKSDHLSMWVQNLSAIEQINDKVIVPNGVIEPNITSNKMEGFSSYGNGIMHMSSGELELEYWIPHAYEVIYNKLDIKLDTANMESTMDWYIWQANTQEWVEVESMNDSPVDYMIDNQVIRFKLVTASPGETSFPQIALEGENLSND